MKGKTFCITGTMTRFPHKKDAWQEICMRGGKAVDELEANCDYLIVSDGFLMSNKARKAARWIEAGRPIIVLTETEFCALLEVSPIVSESQRGEVRKKDQKPVSKVHEVYQRGEVEYDVACSEIPENTNAVFRYTYSSGTPGLNVSITPDGISTWACVPEADRKFASLLSDVVKTLHSQRIPCDIAIFPTVSGISIDLTVIFPSGFIGEAERLFTHLSDAVPESPARVKYRLWTESERYGRYWCNKLLK